MILLGTIKSLAAIDAVEITNIILSGWNGSSYTTREVGDAGFTPIVVEPGALQIYVSDTDGNDSNDGLSVGLPKKTIAAGLAVMRSGQPDILYIKAGDSFSQSLVHLPQGESAAKPNYVTTYGAGARPTLPTFDWNFGGGQTLKKYSNIIGIRFYEAQYDPDSGSFSPASTPGKTKLSEAHTDILFEDCHFDHVELVFDAVTGGTKFTDIRVRRNIFTDNVWAESSINRDEISTGMFATDYIGFLIEENVFDHGGWHATSTNAGGNQYNHNLYLQFNSDALTDDVIVRRNIFTRGSSHGAQMRSGGIADNNFFGRNAIGIVMGSDLADPFTTGTPVIAINNVVSEGQSQLKGDNACFNNDATNLCTNAVRGVEQVLQGDAVYRMEQNIVSTRSPDEATLPNPNVSWGGFAYGALGYHVKGGEPDPGPPTIVDNELYHWDSLTQGDGDGHTERTLGDYYQYLVTQGDLTGSEPGANDFDRFMGVARTRGRGEWPAYMAADAINDYIRVGYSVPGNAAYP